MEREDPTKQMAKAAQEIRELIMNSDLTVKDLPSVVLECERKLERIVIKPNTQLVPISELLSKRSKYYVGE